MHSEKNAYQQSFSNFVDYVYFASQQQQQQPLLEYSSHEAGLRQTTYAAYIRN